MVGVLEWTEKLRIPLSTWWATQGSKSCNPYTVKCRSRQPHGAKTIPVQGEHFSSAPDSNCRPNFPYNGLVFYKGYQGKAGVQWTLNTIFLQSAEDRDYCYSDTLALSVGELSLRVGI